MKIKAKVSKIERVKVECPDDGIHVVGKSGKIKGVHVVEFTEDTRDFYVWKGSVGFYYPINNSRGLKVYFSFTRGDVQSKKAVAREHKQMYKLWKLGLAVKPYGVGVCKIDIDFEGKRYKKNVPYLESQRIYPPEEAMLNYAKGYPYKFESFDHPDHTPEGFKKFVKKVRKHHKIGSCKLGDIIFCTKKKRWLLCDPGG